MTSNNVENIWVLLDSQKEQLDLLTSAATLANQMKVRLQGLFIEEENLIRAADLSISREISLWSAQENQITRKSILRTLQARARQKNKELEDIAHKKHIKCSFQTIRGERMSWILNNTNTPDILFISGKGMFSKHNQYLKKYNLIKYPLHILYNGSLASQRALRIAAKMAGESKRSLQVLLVAGKTANEIELREQIAKLLENHRTTTTIFSLITTKQIIEIQRKSLVHMLLLPSDIEWVHANGHLEKLIQRARCPVVLVR